MMMIIIILGIRDSFDLISSHNRSIYNVFLDVFRKKYTTFFPTWDKEAQTDDGVASWQMMGSAGPVSGGPFGRLLLGSAGLSGLGRSRRPRRLGEPMQPTPTPTTLSGGVGRRLQQPSARAAHGSETAAAMRGLLSSSSTLLRRAAGAAAKLSRAGWSNSAASAPSSLRRFPRQVCPHISLRSISAGLVACCHVIGICSFFVMENFQSEGEELFSSFCFSVSYMSH
jgi:hypothetical protein